VTPVWAQDPQTPENTQPVSVSSDQQAAQNIQGPEDKQKENPPEPESHGTRLRWQDIPKNVLHDEKAVFLSPLHINRDNAKWWILFGGSTAALIAADQRISDSLPQTTSLTTPSRWASRIGADYSIYPLWSTFYLFGKIGDRPRARDTGRLGIEALIDADITAGILKVATQRPRPEIKGQSVGFFEGGDAFPSGHSIKSWALARVVSREYSDNKFVPILAYGLATTVSVARFGGRRHSASDALAGAAMGYFIGDFVYAHHHAPSEKPGTLTWLADHVNFNIGIGR
jgi:membrane-associated phospholipid phosphatase